MNKVYLLAMLVLFALAGCKQSEDLETSVNNRWASIIDNDLDKAYQYFSEGYMVIESIETFKTRIATAKINMDWKNAKFISAKCEQESLCKVSVSVEYAYTFPRRSMGETVVKSELSENWIKQDGTWSYVPDER